MDLRCVKYGGELVQRWLKEEKNFDSFMAITGTVYRQIEARETLSFVDEQQEYFIKKHFKLRFKDIMRAWLRGYMPERGAATEKRAIEWLRNAGVDVPKIAGWGERSRGLCSHQSFLITQSLGPAKNLAEGLQYWMSHPPCYAQKKALIERVARMMRIMHLSGVNHRDCYLVHLYAHQNVFTGSAPIKMTDPLWVLDLHRAQIRTQVPERWLIKDLAGLYFSSLGFKLTSRDYYRFMRIYKDCPLREIFSTERKRWKIIQRKGQRLWDRGAAFKK